MLNIEETTEQLVMEIEGYYLSPQQRRVWSLLPAAQHALCSQSALLIEGHLDPAQLRRSALSLLGRHHILRTCFHHRAGLKFPLQLVAPLTAEWWQTRDFSTLSAPQQLAPLDDLLAQQREEISLQQLTQAPLLRIWLVKFSATRHLLLLMIPALCGDRWTLRQMAAEIADGYADATQMNEAEIAEIEIDETENDEVLQYAQYAEWQNEMLAADESDAGRQYWREQAAGSVEARRAVSVAALAWSKQGAAAAEAGREFRTAVESMELGAAEVAGLERVSAESGVGIEAVLMGCWAVLLWRLGGGSGEEVEIWREAEGRKYEELRGGLGLYAKVVPQRVRVGSGEERIGEIVERASEALRDADDWQAYFDWDELGRLDGDGPEASVIPVGFEFEERRATYRAGDLSFSLLSQFSHIDRFKIKLSCIRHNESLLAEIHYDPDLLKSAHAIRIASYFQMLIQSVAANPKSSIGSFDLLSDADRQQLLVAFNNSVSDYPADKCIHQLFEEQVERTPHNVAVVFKEQQLTYLELNARANQLARRLRQLGVTHDTPVGLSMERSLEMLVGLLGILKAGGAYVPLDPQSPAARLAYQLTEIKAPVLVTQKSLLNRLPTAAVETICLDEDWAQFDDLEKTDLKLKLDSQQLAYVIYTSGSTGTPKGVAISHRSLVNYTHFICQQLQAKDAQHGANRHFAFVSTINADLGNTVIYPSLVSGACLHIFSYETTVDSAMFAGYVKAHPIDVLKIVPSHLNALLTSEEGAEILPREYLILGGEALSLELVKRISEMSTNCQLINHYGPTETTVGCMMNRLVAGEHSAYAVSTVPIGDPVANMQGYILDQFFKPVPIGTPGELFIGGDGLSRGYLNDPERTAERFVPHPFSNSDGKCLYRTGDLARYLPDGKIEFLGRVDQQVKIRGFRIELGEIEAVLQQHPNIAKAVVMPWEDNAKHLRLAAYIVSHQQHAPAVNDLRNFLKDALPEYMMPSVFITLKAFPLTKNGKVDRRALPPPEENRPEMARTFIAPRTPVEQSLADIWGQVLGIAQVGIHDNFFELGGDSILSIQIAARAHQANLRLTPKLLFQHQTIAELAPAAALAAAAATPIEQGAVTGAVPLTPIQHRFFERRMLRPHHFTQAVLLEVHRDVPPVVWQQAISELLNHHDALRMRFVNEAGQWQQLNEPVADGETAAPLMTIIDLTEVKEESAERAALQEAAQQLHTSLSLTDGPLVRAAYFERGTEHRGRLLIVIHHLVVDAVSWRILLEDLQQCCAQLLEGQKMSLPAKTTSFQHWAKNLAAYAESNAVEQQAAYWLQLSEQQLSPGWLPVDRPGADNSVRSAQALSVRLSEAETKALLQDVPGVYRTQINEVLLTALGAALGKWSGQPQMLIEIEGHGREADVIGGEMDLSRTVGWFTVRYPVMVEAKGERDAGTRLKRVKEQLRGIPQQGIGYGLLRYLAADADVRRALCAAGEAAEVSFNYLGQLDRVLWDGGLLGATRESSGATSGRDEQRSHVLAINCGVREGQLEMQWTYSARMFEQSTVLAVADEFSAELRALIAHCRTAEAGGFTPSDFPLAEISQEVLDKLMTKISHGGRR